MVHGVGRGLCAASVVIAGLSFASHAEGAGSPPIRSPIVERRLANGLRVVFAPDDTLSNVSLVVRYEAGDGDDPDGKEGLAHVTEHVLFGAFRQGAHAKLLLQAGASNVGAHTSLDFTSFEETFPPEALDLALWLEGARMATAADPVDEGAVARECEVIGHEYNERGYVHGGFQAVGSLFELAWDELYPEWHPYHFTLGVLGAMNGIGAADVRAFGRTWYGPNNASLVLAGRFDAGSAFELVQRYFGRISPRAAPPRPALPPLPAPGNVWLDVEALVTHPVAMMAWRAPPNHTPEQRALSLAARLLGAPRGILGRRLVEEDGGALRISIRELPASAGSVFVVVIEPKAGVSLGDLLPTAQATMAQSPDRVTEVDLARVKKRIAGEELARLETSMGRAMALADPHRPASLGTDDYDGVDLPGVVDSMRRFLDPGQRVTMVVRPATRPLYGAIAVLLHRDRMSR